MLGLSEVVNLGVELLGLNLGLLVSGAEVACEGAGFQLGDLVSIRGRFFGLVWDPMTAEAWVQERLGFS